MWCAVMWCHRYECHMTWHVDRSLLQKNPTKETLSTLRDVMANSYHIIHTRIIWYHPVSHLRLVWYQPDIHLRYSRESFMRWISQMFMRYHIWDIHRMIRFLDPPKNMFFCDGPIVVALSTRHLYMTCINQTYIYMTYLYGARRMRRCCSGARRIKVWVSFAKEPYKRDYVLQKRRVILLMVRVAWGAVAWGAYQPDIDRRIDRRLNIDRRLMQHWSCCCMRRLSM